jgi:sugar lactone lactonase YvrE
VATADGLHHFDPASKSFTSWHHDPADAGQPGQRPGECAGARRGGRLWVGTASGLDMLPPGGTRFQHYTIDASGDSKFNR